MKRRQLLKYAAAMGGAAFCGQPLGLLDVVQAEDDSSSIDQESLRDLAAARGLVFGAATRQKQLAADQLYADIVAKQCGILTPELELKWEALRPQPNTYDFSGADWLYEFTKTHGMLFRGHTLVWEAALPAWFAGTVNAGNAEKILLDHIATVVGHYAGKMHTWDVVNEGIQVGDGRPDGLKKTPWLEFIGPEYMEVAFHAAHEADPHAILAYNENWLEPEDADADSKRHATLMMLTNLKKTGVPVHALGIQSHIFAEANTTGPNYRQFLKEIADLGLTIQITELDVRDKHLPGNDALRDRLVTTQYYQYLSFMLECKAVKAVLTWGLSDRYTWIIKSHPRLDGLPVRPLPYDSDLQPAPAWVALQTAFEEAPAR